MDTKVVKSGVKWHEVVQKWAYDTAGACHDRSPLFVADCFYG